MASLSDLNSPIRRSHRKRKIKQFDDYEVELHVQTSTDDLADDYDETSDPKYTAEHEETHGTDEDEKTKPPRTKQTNKKRRLQGTYERKKKNKQFVFQWKSSLQVETKTDTDRDKEADSQTYIPEEALTVARFIFRCVTNGCSKQFVNTTKLQDHKKQCHAESLRFTCAGCDKTFAALHTCQSHLRMAHSNTLAVSFSMQNVNVMIDDGTNIVDGQMLVCTKCGFTFSGEQVPDHDCTSLELQYYCPYCEFYCGLGEDMNHHLTGQNKNRFVVGYFMWRVMTGQHRQIEYQMQVPEHHKGEVQGLKNADKYVELRSSAKEPGWSVDNDQTVCELCGTDFNTNTDLKLHLNKKHGQNKNRFVVGYFMWRVMTGQHRQIEYQMQVPEHHKGEVQGLKNADKYVELRSSAKEPGWSVDNDQTVCELCGTDFNTNTDLKLHLNKKHAYLPYACGVCKTCYGRKPALICHMLCHTKPPLRCSVCDKEFYDQSRLDVHMAVHSGDKQYQCYICGNRYCDERSVNKHISVKHPDQSKTQTTVEKYPVTNKNKAPSVCHLCGKSYKTATTLYKHLRSHTDNKQFKCPSCDKTFSEFHLLREHKLTHQALDFSEVGGVKGVSTHTMQEIFQALKVFEEGHPSGMPHKCELCSKRFSKEVFLHRHIRIMHMRSEDKSFVCEVCNKGFTLSSSLRTHMRLHTNIKPYRCRICHRRFRQLGHIKDHLLHHGTANLECALCKKMLKSRGTLRRHVVVHCKIFPLKCPVKNCKSKFHSFPAFLYHFERCSKSVGKDTELECNFCKKSFTKSVFSSHYHTHESEMIFPCHCGMMFSAYYKLYFHKSECRHFEESEIETPCNKNTLNRLEKIVEGMAKEELLRQFDFIEDGGELQTASDNIKLETASDIKLETASDNIKHETVESNIHVTAFQHKPRNCSLKQASVTSFSLKGDDIVDEQRPLDNDGDLIDIAEQLTNMASGFPYREVIIQTTDDNMAGEMTEISIEEVEIQGNGEPGINAEDILPHHGSEEIQTSTGDIQEGTEIETNTEQPSNTTDIQDDIYKEDVVQVSCKGDATQVSEESQTGNEEKTTINSSIEQIAFVPNSTKIEYLNKGNTTENDGDAENTNIMENYTEDVSHTAAVSDRNTANNKFGQNKDPDMKDSLKENFQIDDDLSLHHSENCEQRSSEITMTPDENEVLDTVDNLKSVEYENMDQATTQEIIKPRIASQQDSKAEVEHSPRDKPNIDSDQVSDVGDTSRSLDDCFRTSDTHETEGLLLEEKTKQDSNNDGSCQTSGNDHNDTESNINDTNTEVKREVKVESDNSRPICYDSNAAISDGHSGGDSDAKPGPYVDRKIENTARKVKRKQQNKRKAAPDEKWSENECLSSASVPDRHSLTDHSGGDDIDPDDDWKMENTVRKSKVKIKQHDKRNPTKIRDYTTSEFSPELKKLFMRGSVVYKCTTKTCNRKLKSLNMMLNHKKTAHNETMKFVCKGCDKMFGTFYVYKSHIRMEHSDLDSLPFLVQNVEVVMREKSDSVAMLICVCTKCGYRFQEKETYAHTCLPMELQYYCPCLKFSSSNLKTTAKHIAENHPDSFKDITTEHRYSTLRSTKREPGWKSLDQTTGCESCNITFNTHQEYKQHLNSRHANHPFACGLCETCYGRKSALIKHMLSHKTTDLRCSVCNKEFILRSRLDAHMLTHEGFKPSQCELCGNRYYEERSLKKHVMLKHPDYFKARYPDAIVRTAKYKKKTTRAVCDVCGAVCPSETKLKRHMKKEHSSAYKCPLCEESFTDVMAFKNHKLSHQVLSGTAGLTRLDVRDILNEIKIYEEDHPSGLPYKCGLCEKRFSKIKRVQDHIRVNHIRPEDKKYICQVCNKGFTLHAALQTHLRLHTDSKPYKCRLCDKQFRQLGHIKDHLLHHGKAHLPCALCQKKFKSKGNLNRHIQTHCKIFPYKCPVPGCTAALPNLLTFLSHSTDCIQSVPPTDNLHCNICSKTLQAQHILAHYQTHENDMIYSCTRCHMMFDSYRRLYFHKEKNKHFEESEYESMTNERMVKVKDEVDVNEDPALNMTREELLTQFDYLGENEEITPDNNRNVKLETAEIEIPAVEDNTIVLTEDQLTELSSGIVYVEDVIQDTQLDNIQDVAEVKLNADGQTIMDGDIIDTTNISSDILGRLTGNNQVFEITKPGSENVTYYILQLDQADT